MTVIELLVGRVGRAHGMRGDLVLDVRTDEPERRLAVGSSFDTVHGTLTVAATRWHSGRLLIRFQQVPDRNAAEALHGTELRVEVLVDERPQDPDEFYDHQLVGLTVESELGEIVGQVSEVLHLPAQDMLVIAHAGRETLVPFVAEFVPRVDLGSGRLLVTDRPGLLSDEDGDIDGDARVAMPEEDG